MIDKIIKEIESKEKVLILGFGREGKSTYKLIRKYLKDKHLTICDGNEKLLEQNSELSDDHNLDFVLGSNYLDNLNDYDMIIKSPGVNFKYIDHSKISDKITSQVNLFFKYSNNLTIGVTGTKGKSTTSSMIHYILTGMNKKAILVGNIGIPIFDKIDEFDKDTIVVTELSCHQLQFVKASPNISILLNIYEEHLDLYKSYEEYSLAKINIFKYQKDTDYNIWGLDSPDSVKYFKANNNTYSFSINNNMVKRGILIKEDGLYYKEGTNIKLVYDKKRTRKLLGEHNLYNVAASMCVSMILNLDMDKVCDLVDSFEPLEHRMEFVGTYKGISFYNDSIATIPSACIYCIKSVPNTKTAIVGGMDRGLDLSELVNYFNSSNCPLETIIFLKDTGYNICDELKRLHCNKRLIKAVDMEDAVINAYKYTKEGASCVLAPAAASYNVYKNFEERGKAYKGFVKDFSK